MTFQSLRRLAYAACLLAAVGLPAAAVTPLPGRPSSTAVQPRPTATPSGPTTTPRTGRPATPVIPLRKPDTPATGSTTGALMGKDLNGAGALTSSGPIRSGRPVNAPGGSPPPGDEAKLELAIDHLQPLLPLSAVPAGAVKGTEADILDENGQHISTFQCASEQRTGDWLLHGNADFYVLSFSCVNGRIDGGVSTDVHGATRIDFVFARGAHGALMAGAGPRQLLKADPQLDASTSRAWAEANNCLQLFATYQKDPNQGAFHVDNIGGYGRCTLVPVAAYMKTLSMPAPPPISDAGLPPLDQVKVSGYPYDPRQMPRQLSVFSQWLSDPDCKGGNCTDSAFDDVVWQLLSFPAPPTNGGVPLGSSPPDLAFVTDGKPTYQVVTLSYQPTPTGAPACVPGRAISATASSFATPVPFTSHQASAEEIKDLGLSGKEPWISVFTLTKDQVDTMIDANPTTKIAWMSVNPIIDGKCVTYSSYPMAINGNESPAMRAADQYAAESGLEAAAHQQMTDNEATAKNALFQGQPPQTFMPANIIVAGYTPPYNFHPDPILHSPLMDDDKTLDGLVPLDDAFGKDNDGNEWGKKLVWQFRDDWGGDCSYNPYYFTQAAQIHASPHDFLSDLEWTVNTYATIYEGLKDFTVNGFEYISTGGECPFTPPEAFEPGQTEDMPAACKTYKKGLQFGMKVGMTAMGLPEHLPSSNDLMNLGASYAASEAIDTATDGIDITGDIPDSWHDYAVSQLATRIRNAVKASDCAQPTTPGDTASQDGFDGINPITMCGYNNGSMMNNTAFPDINGDINHSTLYLTLTPNPKALGVDSRFRIYVSVGNGKIPAIGDPTLDKITDAYNKSLAPVMTGASATIDARDVAGQSPMTVPVELTYDQNDWEAAVSAAGTCPQDAFEDACKSEVGRWAFKQTISRFSQSIDVRVTYDWSPPISGCATGVVPVAVLDANGKPTGEVNPQVESRCVSEEQKVQFTAVSRQGPLGKAIGNEYMFALGNLHACPGMELNWDNDVGIPTGTVRPADNAYNGL